MWNLEPQLAKKSIALLVSVVIIVGLFYAFTLTGKAMQACAFNRSIAKLMGINDRLMILLAFAMSALVGAVAGYMVTPITLMDTQLNVWKLF